MTTYSDAWQALETHHANTQHVTLRERFVADVKRFNNVHEVLHGLLFDYSKNRLDENTLGLLRRLAETADLPQYMQTMFNGEKINTSEHRAVPHIALRLSANAQPIYIDGENIVFKVHHELNRTLESVRQLLSGTHTGITDRLITDLVHIGIGGFDLGPRMIAQAPQPYWQNIHIRFVSNSDDVDLTQTFLDLNPETTVFSITSKSFHTLEILLNAYAVCTWYCDAGLPDSDIYRHFCAISADVAVAQNFGISPDKVFAVSDWVGGHYSVWSPIGLPLMVAVGKKALHKMLAGARAMDTHFFEIPFRRSIPVLTVLTDVWCNNFQHSDGQTVVSYNHNMRPFTPWFNQLDMESLGKQRTSDGQPVSYTTGGIVFGDEGVNCQHAYFQPLHQDTRLIPVDFTAPMTTIYGNHRQHRFTVANASTQTEALMKSKTLNEVQVELAALPQDEHDRLAPQKEFPDNRPSNSLPIDSLIPFNLGILMTAYEHRTFIQGVTQHINPFNQWGVKYGKELARAIEPELERSTPAHDSSINSLTTFYRNCNTASRAVRK